MEGNINDIIIFFGKDSKTGLSINNAFKDLPKVIEQRLGK